MRGELLGLMPLTDGSHSVLPQGSPNAEGPRVVRPCRTCHEPTSVVCVGCGAVQVPPVTIDPFAVFGLSPVWHLDLLDLEARYRALARLIHPDRQGGKAATDRMYALQWTAGVNEARRLLKDDVKRAWYLATGSPVPKEKGVTLSPEFLAEMFEWREEEEECPGSRAERSAVRATEIRAELDAMFSAWEAGSGDLSRVEEALSRLRYVS